MDRATMREKGFFIIVTDDGDRNLYEVFAKGEMVELFGNIELASQKLQELRDDYQIELENESILDD